MEIRNMQTRTRRATYYANKADFLKKLIDGLDREIKPFSDQVKNFPEAAAASGLTAKLAAILERRRRLQKEMLRALANGEN
jgi:hypothetical protein